jgi:hypothetical protein
VLACLIPQDVNPQLKGHLVGALNNGATEDEVKAVREVVIKGTPHRRSRKDADPGRSREVWRKPFPHFALCITLGEEPSIPVETATLTMT